jgi:hypothetical protein
MSNFEGIEVLVETAGGINPNELGQIARDIRNILKVYEPVEGTGKMVIEIHPELEFEQGHRYKGQVRFYLASQYGLFNGKRVLASQHFQRGDIRRE